jgi:hypothetical protein
MVLSLQIEYPPNIGKNIKVWVTSKQYEHVVCTKNKIGGKFCQDGNLLPTNVFWIF